jgi:hypothetical protein
LARKQHKYAGASASISTDLDAGRIAEICEDAARQAETVQTMVRLEESKPGRLVYSVRNRLTGGRVEFMTFAVSVTDGNAPRRLATRILTYKVKRQWILVVPLPWRMMAWGNYKKFMNGLADGIRAADPRATARIVEMTGSA